MINNQSISAAEAMLKYKPDIEELWAQIVKAKIRSASELADPILFNYFPNLLQRIAEALAPDSNRIDAVEGNTSAHEHGAERARLTTFNISQIATEFYALKEAIHNVLGSRAQLTQKEIIIIDRSIDQSLQESITSFVLAEAYIREQFIAMLAHDIRGPISFIKMATTLLLEGTDPQEAHELFRRIADSAENAGILIDNILDASVIKASRRIKLGIEHIDILGVIQKVLRQHSNPRIRLEGQSVMGYWCPRGVSRVIQNLVDNALKYGENNTDVTVKLEEIRGAVHISVHNEGQPIPVEQQENIFQPFHRSHGAQGYDIKGWGFGLPIVRGITEAHGGTIEVDSALGRGTTITVTLPGDARPYQNAPTFE
ncbi:MAG: sensor histidine kinase [Pseudobdellovibrionaceae bacterium]|nr:sensor histidine kinase [Pseudobdellovibrionaceae bacterium]